MRERKRPNDPGGSSPKGSPSKGCLPPGPALKGRAGNPVPIGGPLSGWTSSDRSSRLPSDWESRRSQVLRRDKGVCQIRSADCWKAATEVDHINRGDDHSLRNLRAVCAHCHARKSSAEGHARKAELRTRRRRVAERHPGAL
ncbi:HNH endonuclease [Nocardia sp. IFM 10818]